MYINSISCPTDKFITEILNLLRPHVEHSPNTDPFVIFYHIFGTYQNLQNLLQYHSTDIQTLTLSTIHVNDFRKKSVVLEISTRIQLLELSSSSSSLVLFKLSLLLKFHSQCRHKRHKKSFSQKSFTNIFQNIFSKFHL